METSPCRTAVSSFLISLAALSICGCSSLKGFSDPSTATSPLPAITGMVHGGVQPISGSTIQLYATNTTTSKGASSALLTNPPITNANGGFSITETNYCPAPTSLVYLVATGGNPGLTPPTNGTINNTDIALMVLLGTCSSLSSITSVTVNELTTVAAVEALAPFMADFSHIGADASNPNGMAGAFAGAASIVSLSTGAFVTPGASITLPTTVYNTLADILAACVSTSGGAAGTQTNCGTLLQYATNGSTPDTASAMLHIAQLPAQNVRQLFSLVSTQSPFQPALTNRPSDFTATSIIALPFASPTFATMLAVDTAQHVWVASQTPSSPNPTTGPLTVFDNNGNVLFTVQPGTGGLYLPVKLAADPFGNMWALNNNLTLSKFDANGNPLSPTGGFPILATSVGQTPLLGSDFGLDLFSIDPSGNLWGAGTGTASNNCYVEVNNAGSVITPSSSFCASGGSALFTATDGSGNAWLQGNNAIAKVNSAGTLLATGVNTNGCFNASSDSQYATIDLQYDRVNNQLWGLSELGVGALQSNGSQVFCDAPGNAPVIPPYSTIPSGCTTNCTGTAGVLIITSASIDGAGTMWFNTSGPQTIAAPGSITLTSVAGLNALDKSGNLLTPFNAATGTYGLQSNVYLFGGGVFEGMAIDSYGNIWMIGSPIPSTDISSGPASPITITTGESTTANQLVKLSGMATPKTYQ